MAKRPTNQAIIELCKLNMGNVTGIAKALKVTTKSVYEWITKDKQLKQAFEDQKESNIDFVESKLFQRINGYTEKDLYISQYQGEVVSQEIQKIYPPDTTSIIFYLKTKAKSRGYVERSEYELSGELQTNKTIFKMPDGTEVVI